MINTAKSKGDTVQMKQKIFCIVLMVLTLTLLTVQYSFAQADKQLYLKAQKSIKSGQMDFAFLRYHELLLSYPNSKYRNGALFGVGEYYFLNNNYQEAKEAFEQYVHQNSDFKKKLFAYSYLLKIARNQNDQAAQDKIIENILSLRQMGFVFNTSKEYHFYSSLNQHLKAIFTINTITFYINDQPFVEVSYE